MLRKQKRLTIRRPAPDHHIVLLLVLPARVMCCEDRLLLHADVCPRGIHKPFDLIDNQLAPPIIRQADRVVLSMNGALTNQLTLVVGVVRPQPHRLPLGHHPGAPLEQLAPVQRHPTATRLQLPRRPQPAKKRDVQPVPTVSVVVLARPLEQTAVYLNAGRVKAVRSKSVNSNSTFGGGSFASSKFTCQVSCCIPLFLHASLAIVDLADESVSSLSGD